MPLRRHRIYQRDKCIFNDIALDPFKDEMTICRCNVPPEVAAPCRGF
jgi:hypothetical protein